MGGPAEGGRNLTLEPLNLRGQRKRPPRSCPTLLARARLFIGLKTVLIRDLSKEADKLLLHKVL